MKKFFDLFIIIFIILIITIAQFSTDIYLPSLPAMKDFFHSTADQMQLTITIELIGFALSSFFYGPLADRFGRKKTLIIGLLIFLIGTAISLTSTKKLQLFIGRFIQGAGIGNIGAIAPAMVKDCFHGKKMTRVFSLISIALAITPIIAPIIGGYLQEHFFWQANFLFLLAYAFVLFIILVFFLPETNKSLSTHSMHPKKIINEFIKILSKPIFVGLVICLIFTYAGEMSYLIMAPFLLQEKLGLSPIEFGWLALVPIGGYICGALLSMQLSKTKSNQKLIFIGIFLLMLGSLMMLIFGAIKFFTILFVVMPMFFFMMGTGLIYPNTIAYGVNLFPDKAGKASALLSGLELGGGALLTIIAEQLSFSSQLPLGILLFSFSLILFILSIFLIKNEKARTEEDSNL